MCCSNTSMMKEASEMHVFLLLFFQNLIAMCSNKVFLTSLIPSKTATVLLQVQLYCNENSRELLISSPV